MSVQSINNAIDGKIVDTNDRINKSVEVRHNANDKNLQKQLDAFDKTYLNDEERKAIDALNDAEQEQFKESKKYAAKSALNTVKAVTGGIFGKTTGILGAADNSQRLNDSEKKLGDISDARDEIRANALARRFKSAETLMGASQTQPANDRELEV